MLDKKNRCSVFRGSLQYARTLGSVSFAHPTRNEGSGVGTLGACVEPLGHKSEREVVSYRDDHYILHEDILQHR